MIHKEKILDFLIEQRDLHIRLCEKNKDIDNNYIFSEDYDNEDSDEIESIINRINVFHGKIPSYYASCGILSFIEHLISKIESEDLEK